MYSICWTIFLICFLQYAVYTKRRGGKDKEVDENYIRHVIEDGVKPAIFGSNSYDPIKQIFEPIKDRNVTCKSCKSKKGGSTVAADDAGETNSTTQKTEKNEEIAEADYAPERKMRASTALDTKATTIMLKVDSAKLNKINP